MSLYIERLTAPGRKGYLRRRHYLHPERPGQMLCLKSAAGSEAPDGRSRSLCCLCRERAAARDRQQLSAPPGWRFTARPAHMACRCGRRPMCGLLSDDGARFVCAFCEREKGTI